MWSRTIVSVTNAAGCSSRLQRRFFLGRLVGLASVAAACAISSQAQAFVHSYSGSDNNKKSCPDNDDPYNLVERFVQTQAAYQDVAVAELQAGRKRSHWSWFIFPTPPYMVNGIERGSPTNKYYALRNRHETEAYLQMPPVTVADNKDQKNAVVVDLRANYLQIMNIIATQLETHSDMTPLQLVGGLDVKKLRSSAQHFHHVASTLEPIPDDEVAEACRRVLAAMDDCNDKD